MAGELIFVVDDELNIVDLARMYLEREGFWVAAVGDGLAIAREVVLAHRGEIAVICNSEKGGLQVSEFVVKIPVALPEDSTLTARNM